MSKKTCFCSMTISIIVASILLIKGVKQYLGLQELRGALSNLGYVSEELTNMLKGNFFEIALLPSLPYILLAIVFGILGNLQEKADDLYYMVYTKMSSRILKLENRLNNEINDINIKINKIDLNK